MTMTLPVLALLALIAVWRCVGVARGYFSFVRRASLAFLLWSNKERFRGNDDEDWARGIGAVYSRYFLVVFFAIVSVNQVLEGRAPLLSAIPATLAFIAVDLLDSFKGWRYITSLAREWGLSATSPRATTTTVRMRNERHRFVYRTVQWIYSGYTQYLLYRNIADPRAFEGQLRRATFLRAFAGFALFPDLEEQLFEILQPIAIAFLVLQSNDDDHDGRRRAVLRNLLGELVKIATFLAIPSILQLRGAFARRVLTERARPQPNDGNEEEQEEEDDVVGNNGEERARTTSTRRVRIKPATRSLLYKNPVAAVVLCGTTILSLVAMGRLELGREGKPHVGGKRDTDNASNVTSSLSLGGYPFVDLRPAGAGFLIAAVIVRRAASRHLVSIDERLAKFYEWERTDERRRRFSSLALSTSTLIAIMCLAWITRDATLVGGFVLATAVLFVTRRVRALRLLLIIVRVATLRAREEVVLDGPMIVLLTARLVGSFEARPLSRILTDSLISSGLTCFLSPKIDLPTFMVVQFSVLAALFVALGSQVSRFQAFELTRMSGESQAHLDHAIKQKLAGVSSAVESCMLKIARRSSQGDLSPTVRGMEASPSQMKKPSMSDPSLLSEILRETYVLTRRHHDMCHLRNLSKVLESTKKRGGEQNGGSGEGRTLWLGTLNRGTTGAPAESSTFVSHRNASERDASAILEDWHRRMSYMGVDLDVSRLEARDSSLNRHNLVFTMNWDLTYYLVFSLLDDFSPVVRRNREGKNVTLAVDYVFPESSANLDADHRASPEMILRLETGFVWGAKGPTTTTIAAADSADRKSHEDANKRSNRASRRILQVQWLIDELGVTFPLPNEMRIPVKIHVSRAPGSPRSSQSDSHPTPLASRGGVPPHLVYGILDDVPLVRLMTLSLLVREFQADSSKTFVCGSSKRDAETNFFRLVRERRPDVLILDYYLDFSEEERESDEEEDARNKSVVAASSSSMSGMDVARRCRMEVGYEGVILIHTANEGLREGLDYSLVDGFLSKSFTRASYERAISEAWGRRRGVD